MVYHYSPVFSLYLPTLLLNLHFALKEADQRRCCMNVSCYFQGLSFTNTIPRQLEFSAEDILLTLTTNVANRKDTYRRNRSIISPSSCHGSTTVTLKSMPTPNVIEEWLSSNQTGSVVHCPALGDDEKLTTTSDSSGSQEQNQNDVCGDEDDTKMIFGQTQECHISVGATIYTAQENIYGWLVSLLVEALLLLLLLFNSNKYTMSGQIHPACRG
ncbi:uncharacterized protein LOC125455448 isoform X2 [Stegostoma tigrinum]|uniref:uncharacterized protein LOC125455448 isoform X2 n=1 Tax=Stegostoma tigrinum TaxID=3053191 RepID=UPI00202B6035|nr:uncharacterized protein LOC125455448 isoform X2 [Stegostoma tigrinum]